jgi:hypothetical protein
MITLTTSLRKIEPAFEKFPKHHMKILLGDFNANREDIFKPTIGNKSLHEISNSNRVSVVNFVTSKNLSQVQCSHIVTFIHLLGHLLTERLTIKVTIFSRPGDGIQVYLMFDRSG